MRKLITIMFIISLTTSCAKRIHKAVNDAKYSAYETVGLEKRDLFKREVSNVKEDQEDTGEAFKDALTRLKEIYNVDGGDLEKQYSKLKDSLDDAKAESTDLSARIRKVDEVANDLFVEWKEEINEIKTSDLRSKSSKKLSETKNRYHKLEQQLNRSEKKIGPVLAKLNDQVLYLKHNLNAKAIGGLKEEQGKIQADIKSLIKEVDESTRQADVFIQSL
jgi:chromosome segregation ATPase